MVASLKPGKKIFFEVLRKGKRKKLHVKIGTFPDGSIAQENKVDKSEKKQLKLGLKLRELTPELQRRLGARELDGGAVVVGLLPSSPFVRDLREGDVIVEVNQNRIKAAADFKKAIKELKSGDDILLRVYRSGGYSYVVVRL